MGTRWIVAKFSSVSILVFLLWMKLTIPSIHHDTEATHAKVTILGTQFHLFRTVNCLLTSGLSAMDWHNLISVVLRAHNLIERNVEQLLLFTTLSKDSSIDLWNQKDIARLR